MPNRIKRSEFPASHDGRIEPVDFSLVFDATPTPYLLLGANAPTFTIVGVNAAYLAATGTRREAIIGHGLFDVFPDNPGDPTASGVSDLRASLDRVLRDRARDVMGIQKYDIPLRDRPGVFEVRYWSPINTPVASEDGAIRCIIHRVEDVTDFVLARQSAEWVGRLADHMQAEVLNSGAELKQANRRLKVLSERLSDLNALQAAQAQARLSFALDSAGMGELVLDPATDRTVHSPGLAKLLGYPGDRILGREEIRQAVHPDDRAMVAAHRDSAIAGPGEAFEIEHRVVWPDGTIRWLANRGRVARGADGEPVEVTAVFFDITERKLADAQQRLLLDELNHRVKNTLATVQSIARQTRRSAGDADAFNQAFEGRLAALSRAHDLLTKASWHGASLAEVLRETLAPHQSGADEAARVTIEGPPIRLRPNAAVTLNMAFHEMATNALKYGALSCEAGRLSVCWAVDAGPDPAGLTITWIESGGPPVDPPLRRGFGARLLEQGLTRELDGVVRLDYLPEGVRCAISLPLSRKVVLG